MRCQRILKLNYSDKDHHGNLPFKEIFPQKTENELQDLLLTTRKSTINSTRKYWAIPIYTTLGSALTPELGMVHECNISVAVIII